MGFEGRARRIEMRADQTPIFAAALRLAVPGIQCRRPSMVRGAPRQTELDQ